MSYSRKDHTHYKVLFTPEFSFNMIIIVLFMLMWNVWPGLICVHIKNSLSVVAGSLQVQSSCPLGPTLHPFAACWSQLPVCQPWYSVFHWEARCTQSALHPDQKCTSFPLWKRKWVVRFSVKSMCMCVGVHAFVFLSPLLLVWEYPDESIRGSDSPCCSLIGIITALVWPSRCLCRMGPPACSKRLKLAPRCGPVSHERTHACTRTSAKSHRLIKHRF